ncbi:hypothetical protein JL722_3465 [Aureococcus anophagefferens]|nr:hypothetical protein JL722_3465 [Aureococcus anophagefferens]
MLQWAMLLPVALAACPPDQIVFGVGLPKSGTRSMGMALQALGFTASKGMVGTRNNGVDYKFHADLLPFVNGNTSGALANLGASKTWAGSTLSTSSLLCAALRARGALRPGALRGLRAAPARVAACVPPARYLSLTLAEDSAEFEKIVDFLGCDGADRRRVRAAWDKSAKQWSGTRAARQPKPARDAAAKARVDAPAPRRPSSPCAWLCRALSCCDVGAITDNRRGVIRGLVGVHIFCIMIGIFACLGGMSNSMLKATAWASTEVDPVYDTGGDDPKIYIGFTGVLYSGKDDDDGVPVAGLENNKFYKWNKFKDYAPSSEEDGIEDCEAASKGLLSVNGLKIADVAPELGAGFFFEVIIAVFGITTGLLMLVLGLPPKSTEEAGALKDGEGGSDVAATGDDYA